MQSKDILYSAGGNDECYTPAYGVVPIIKYLPKDKIIWCPFDKENSEFVLQLEGGGVQCYLYTHGLLTRFFQFGARALGYYRIKSSIYRQKKIFGKGIEFLKTICTHNDKYMAEGFSTKATF